MKEGEPTNITMAASSTATTEFSSISNARSTFTVPSTDNDANYFTVGQLVEVESRSWPGINEPGGVGRITGIAADRVSVRYLMGHRRHEKDVLLRFVRPYQLSEERLRDRAMLLGRCQNCGSLRTDCGSCELWSVVQEAHLAATQASIPNTTPAHAQNHPLHDSDSDDSSSLEEDWAKQRRRIRRYQRMKTRVLTLLGLGNDEKSARSQGSSRSDSSSSEDEDEDYPLQQLVWQASQPRIARAGRISLPQRRKRYNTSRQVGLDSSSSSDDDDDPVRTSAARSGGRKRDNDDKSLASVSSSGTPDLSQRPSQEESPDALPRHTATDTDYAVFSSDSEGEQMLGSGDLGGATLGDEFIQPEGDASHLPHDIVDRTRNLQYRELAPFFDNILDKLKSELLPSAQERVEKLEQRIERVKSQSAPTSLSGDDFLKQWETLHNDLIYTLIRDGTDQCQAALKKLSSRKLYNKHKSSLPSHNQDRKLEERGFQLDVLLQSVEELMSRLRSCKPLLLASDNDDGEYGDDSDGWADEAGSPQRLLQDSPGITVDPPGSISPLDPHVHASTKRRGSVGVARKRNRDTKSSKERKGTSSRRTQDRTNKRREYQLSDANRNSTRRLTGKENNGVGSTPEKESIEKGGTSEVEEDSSSVHFEFEAKVAGHSQSAPNELRGSKKRQRSGTKRLRCSTNYSLGKRQRNEPDITTNMERWLATNAAINRGADFNASGETGAHPPGHRQRKIAPRPHQNMDSVVQAPSLRVLEIEAVGDTLHQQLFARLATGHSSRRTGNQMVSSELPPTRSAGEICQIIESDFPSFRSLGLIDEVMRQVSVAGGNVNVPLVMTALVRALQCQGCPTLQELVSQNSSTLPSYIALYVALLHIIKMGLHKDLEPSHGIAYDLFSPTRCIHFLDFLILQLVDSVYSLVHPSAWVLPVKSRQIRVLCPLRDAMAEHFLLTERVSRCVVKELGVQVWRWNDEKRITYVSSVDPDQWRKYLTSSLLPTLRVDSRFAQLGEVLPSCDIQATWSLLAYFACAASRQQECIGEERWSLVSELLTRGALLDSDGSDILPPCNDQLLSAGNGIRYLSYLVLSGSMGSCPRLDKFFVDIVKRSLTVEVAYIFCLKESREAVFPSVRNEKSERKNALSLWHHVEQEEGEAGAETVQTSISQIAKGMLSTHISDLWMSQPTMLPSSELLRCCLGLFLAWSDNVSSGKPTRWRRFDQAVNALVKNVLAEAKTGISQGRDESSHGDMDAFQQAFSENLAPPKAGLPGSRRELFLQESAAYLKIYSMLGTPEQNGLRDEVRVNVDVVTPLAKEVWSILADEAMQSQHTGVMPTTSLRSNFVYRGDILRPYVAAKVCTFISMLSLGVSPMGSPAPEGFRGFHRQGGENAFEYLFGCLVVCLECASSGGSPEVASSIARLMTLVLQRSGRKARLLEPFTRVVRAVETSFRATTSAAFCGTEEDICLVTLLSLLRSILLLDWPTSGQDEASVDASFDNGNGSTHQDAGAETDAIWGGLPDSILEKLELGDTYPVDSSEDRVCDCLQSLFRCLFASLDHAKPSNRYAIVRLQGPNDGGGTMSPQGKVLLGRRHEMVSCVLGNIIAHPAKAFRTSCDLFREVLGHCAERSGHMDDSEYQTRICRAVSVTLCRLAASSPKAAQIIREHMVDVRDVLVDSLLDFHLMEKIPTCNLEGVKLRSGDTAEDRAVADYDNYSKKMSSARGKAAVTRKNTWCFAKDFGTALKLSDDEQARRMASYVLEHEVDIQSSASIKLVPSLERECLDRFRFFRGLLHFSCTPPYTEYERFAATLVVSSADNLRKLVRVLSVEDKAKNNETASYRYAKLFELFSCYAELHVTLVAWILRERTFRASDGFSRIWISICNVYISPILKGDDFSLSICLSQVRDIALHGRQTTTSVTKDNETDDYGKIVRACMIRRCREWVLSLSMASRVGNTENVPASLLPAILALTGTNGRSAAKIIRSAFSANSYCKSSPVGDAVTSPLRFELEKYMAWLDEHIPSTPEIRASVGDLKRKAISLIAASLTTDRNNLKKKTGALMLLQEMFEMEHNEEAAQSELRMMEIPVQTLCSIARGISVILKCTLMQASIDDELLALLFTCAASLAGLPASTVDSQATGWMADWCVTRAGLDNSDEIGTTPVFANYLVSFVSWLRTIAAAFANTNETALESIHECRRALSSARTDGSVLPWPILRGIVSAGCTGRMQELEKRLRPLQTTATLKNVYSVARPQSDSHELVRWLPSPAVRNAASRFAKKVEIRYATSQ